MKKGVVVAVICLMILTSVPMVSGGNTQLVNSEVLIDEKRTSANTGSLAYNLEIECTGLICFVDLFLAILDLPVFYTRIQISNNNIVPVNINQHITLTTKDGRVLYDFHNNVPFPLKSNWDLTTLYFIRPEWKAVDYMWGFFDITLDLHVLDDDSRTKLVFHGFIFNIGAVIFNPEGEKIY